MKFNLITSKKKDLDEQEDGLTAVRFLELIVIGICSSIVILQLIWKINEYRGVAD